MGWWRGVPRSSVRAPCMQAELGDWDEPGEMLQLQGGHMGYFGWGGGRNMHPWVLTHSLVVLVALHVELLEDDVGQPWHVAVHGLEAQ